MIKKLTQFIGHIEAGLMERGPIAFNRLDCAA